MKQEKVLTTNDIVFKKVFTSPQNSHILIGFINDILELEVTEVDVGNTYNFKTICEENKNPEVRYTEVDVLARLQDGSQIIIEMQVCKRRWFRERAMFYMTERYSNNYGNQDLEIPFEEYSGTGKKYSSLRPTYGIFIMLDNEFNEDDIPIHRFRVKDIENDLTYKNSQGQELFTMIFLELRKSSTSMRKEIRQWFDYFLKGKVKNDAPKYLQDACKEANYHNLEEEE